MGIATKHLVHVFATKVTMASPAISECVLMIVATKKNLASATLKQANVSAYKDAKARVAAQKPVRRSVLHTENANGIPCNVNVRQGGLVKRAQRQVADRVAMLLLGVVDVKKPQGTVNATKATKVMIAPSGRVSHPAAWKMVHGAILSLAHVCAKANGLEKRANVQCVQVSRNVVDPSMVSVTPEKGSVNASDDLQVKTACRCAAIHHVPRMDHVTSKVFVNA